jgi:hypothetical protein
MQSVPVIFVQAVIRSRFAGSGSMAAITIDYLASRKLKKNPISP